jgi:hypothetical protein
METVFDNMKFCGDSKCGLKPRDPEQSVAAIENTDIFSRNGKRVSEFTTVNFRPKYVTKNVISVETYNILNGAESVIEKSLQDIRCPFSLEPEKDDLLFRNAIMENDLYSMELKMEFACARGKISAIVTNTICLEYTYNGAKHYKIIRAPVSWYTGYKKNEYLYHYISMFRFMFPDLTLNAENTGYKVSVYTDIDVNSAEGIPASAVNRFRGFYDRKIQPLSLLKKIQKMNGDMIVPASLVDDPDTMDATITKTTAIIDDYSKKFNAILLEMMVDVRKTIVNSDASVVETISGNMRTYTNSSSISIRINTDLPEIKMDMYCETTMTPENRAKLRVKVAGNNCRCLSANVDRHRCCDAFYISRSVYYNKVAVIHKNMYKNEAVMNAFEKSIVAMTDSEFEYIYRITEDEGKILAKNTGDIHDIFEQFVSFNPRNPASTVTQHEEQIAAFVNQIPTLITTLKNRNEAKRVIGYFYTITEDMNHKIKFSSILEKVQEKWRDITNITLNNHLQSLNLVKKRQNDGIYFHGLKEKMVPRDETEDSDEYTEADAFMNYYESITASKDRYELLYKDYLDMTRSPDLARILVKRQRESDESLCDSVKRYSQALRSGTVMDMIESARPYQTDPENTTRSMTDADRIEYARTIRESVESIERESQAKSAADRKVPEEIRSVSMTYRNVPVTVYLHGDVKENVLVMVYGLKASSTLDHFIDVISDVDEDDTECDKFKTTFVSIKKIDVYSVYPGKMTYRIVVTYIDRDRRECEYSSTGTYHYN